MVVLWVGKRRCLAACSAEYTNGSVVGGKMRCPAACSAECTNGSVVGGQEEMSCCMLC